MGPWGTSKNNSRNTWNIFLGYDKAPCNMTWFIFCHIAVYKLTQTSKLCQNCTWCGYEVISHYFDAKFPKNRHILRVYTRQICNTSKMIHKYCDTRVFLLCGNCPGGKSQIPFGLLWFSHKKICDVHLWRNLGFVRLWSTKFRNFWYFNQQPNHMGPWNIPKTNSRVCIWVQIFPLLTYKGMWLSTHHFVVKSICCAVTRI